MVKRDKNCTVYCFLGERRGGSCLRSSWMMGIIDQEQLVRYPSFLSANMNSTRIIITIDHQTWLFLRRMGTHREAPSSFGPCLMIWSRLGCLFYHSVCKDHSSQSKHEMKNSSKNSRITCIACFALVSTSPQGGRRRPTGVASAWQACLVAWRWSMLSKYDVCSSKYTYKIVYEYSKYIAIVPVCSSVHLPFCHTVATYTPSSRRNQCIAINDAIR